MEYYVITPSLDVNIIGNYPQVKEVKQNCDVWNNSKFIQNLNFEKASYEPITSNAVLYHKSKKTDLIDVVAMGFSKKLLISGKLKEILFNNRKTGIQFFRSGIYHKDEFFQDYWILNMYESNMNFIDYPNSDFVLTKRKPEGGTFVEKINVNNMKEFQSIFAKKQDYSYIQFYIERIKLTQNINEDFFMLLHVEGGVKYIVSDKLKNEINNAKCTGIEFMPVEIRLVEWLQGGVRKKYYFEKIK